MDPLFPFPYLDLQKNYDPREFYLTIPRRLKAQIIFSDKCLRKTAVGEILRHRDKYLRRAIKNPRLKLPHPELEWIWFGRYEGTGTRYQGRLSDGDSIIPVYSGVPVSRILFKLLLEYHKLPFPGAGCFGKDQHDGSDLPRLKKAKMTLDNDVNPFHYGLGGYEFPDMKFCPREPDAYGNVERMDPPRRQRTFYPKNYFT